MTIILQHQFWDLVVTDDRLEVGLSFNGIPERLVVPFNSIKSFFDPSVQFGLQFEANEEAASAPQRRDRTRSGCRTHQPGGVRHPRRRTAETGRRR